MKKAILYARVSSSEQAKEGFSIPAQSALLKKYALENKFEIIEEFIDIETAKRAGRTGFGSMLCYLKENPSIRVVLVEKTDRLYRNFKDYVTIDELDLEIHLVKENEVLSNDSKSHQKFIHGIKVLMAKNYIDNLSEEVKKGQTQKAELGEYPGLAPLGYINNKEIHKVEIDKERYKVVQKMFVMYASGNYSLKKLEDFIYNEGLRSRSGKKYHKSKIEKLLKNPFYYGYFIWKNKMYKGIHEPIIDKDLFDMVQKQFSNKRRPKTKKPEFVFAGLMTCAECGCAMTSEIQKGKYIYYHCTGHRGKCSTGYVREEKIAEEFGRLIEEIQISEEMLNLFKSVLITNHKEQQDYHNAQLDTLQKRYKQIQNRLSTIYDDKLDGVISDDMYFRKKEEYEKECNQLLNKIEQYQKANISYMDQGIKFVELLKDAYSIYKKGNFAKNRKLIQILFSNCVWNGVSLCVEIRKPFSLMVNLPEVVKWGE